MKLPNNMVQMLPNAAWRLAAGLAGALLLGGAGLVALSARGGFDAGELSSSGLLAVARGGDFVCPADAPAPLCEAFGMFFHRLPAPNNLAAWYAGQEDAPQIFGPENRPPEVAPAGTTLADRFPVLADVLAVSPKRNQLRVALFPDFSPTWLPAGALQDMAALVAGQPASIAVGFSRRQMWAELALVQPSSAQISATPADATSAPPPLPLPDVFGEGTSLLVSAPQDFLQRATAVADAIDPTAAAFLYARARALLTDFTGASGALELADILTNGVSVWQGEGGWIASFSVPPAGREDALKMLEHLAKSHAAQQSAQLVSHEFADGTVITEIVPCTSCLEATALVEKGGIWAYRLANQIDGTAGLAFGATEMGHVLLASNEVMALRALARLPSSASHQQKNKITTASFPLAWLLTALEQSNLATFLGLLPASSQVNMQIKHVSDAALLVRVWVDFPDVVAP